MLDVVFEIVRLCVVFVVLEVCVEVVESELV